MPITIGVNISSLRALGALDAATKGLASGHERLASGLRINRASDDAAGLAIASSLTTGRRVLGRAVANANDAISMLNIAADSSDQLSSVLTRIRELAAQSANGTFSSTQRRAVDQEAQALVNEYNRLIQSTTFNGLTLHTANQSTSFIQLGFGTAATIGMTLGDELERTVGTGRFTPGPGDTSLPGAGSLGVRMADFNGDGILDIASAQSGSPLVSIRTGNGDGSFQAAVTVNVGENALSISAGDANNDGKDDVLITSGSGKVWRIRHNGTTYVNGGSVSMNIEADTATAVAVGDFNGDGINDLVASTGHTFGGGVASIAYGTAGGSFTYGGALGTSLGTSSGTISVGDFNGDGRDDFATSYATTSSVAIFMNTGSGTGGATTFAVTQLTGSGTSQKLTVGDLNNDGLDDIISASGPSWLASSSGGFTSTTSVTGVGSDLGLADLNGDGNLDVFGTTGLALLAKLGNGDGTFGTVNSTSTSVSSVRVAAGDVNGDGVADIAIGGIGTVTVTRAITQESTTLPQIYLRTREQALAAFATIDAAMDRVTAERGAIGAGLSRLESAMRTVGEAETNYAAAAGRIQDADVASESARLVRYQILQNTASSVLAQANQVPGIVLQLLKE